ncbi:efflux RND transporter periplasmic adaptor subunit [Kordiimonas aquimaris]|uniref:efflux RND transporter periplasmic adaptor subunit n=1 Tax=Kordiimonas aquimaris TaxID=707591 RepID=UPI0021D330EE|nr:efflux RND transporter periplasmic adaptor subunit [Kordiimonas aquimaris]
MAAQSKTVLEITRQTISTVVALVAIAVVILLVTVGLYQRAAISKQTETFTLPVNTSKVTLQLEYMVNDFYAGRVETLQANDLSFEQPGKILAMFVDEGTAVNKGDAIAQQDTLILEANRSQTMASLERIAAQVQLAQLTEARRKKLFEQGHSNEQQYDEARLNTQTLQAQYKEIEAALKTIDVNIEKSTLYAPFDGIVGQRFVDVGGVLNAGTPVVNLMETGVQLARISMPAMRVALLNAEQNYEIAYGDKKISAKIYSVRPDVNSQTRTQDVLFKLDTETPIAIGELVELQFANSRKENGYWMPTEALVEGTKGLWTVFAVGDDNVVVRRSVEIIHAETSRVFVRANLGANNQVVTNGTHRIVPGQKVAPTNERSK